MYTLTYRLCKAKIDKQQYESFEQMQAMLDVFYVGGRLKTEEYQELSALLESQQVTA